jgi:hypothetical protein
MILVVIIVLSLLASSLRTERFAVPSSNINKTSQDAAALGLGDLASAPSSAVRSSVALVPTLDDLLTSAYLQPDYTRGLAGTESISARTCPDDDLGNTTLAASMDSNKTNCSVVIDLQPYTFRSAGLQLKVLASKSNGNSLVVIPDKAFMELLLLRPAFFTVENSQPYSIDYMGVTPFLFSTIGIANVNTYKSFPHTSFTLPLKTLPNTPTTLFPVNTIPVMSVLNQKVQHIRRVSGDATADVVAVKVAAYYVKRKESFGNSVAVRNSETTAYLSSSPYITSLISTIKSPPSTMNPSNVSNPTFSVAFDIAVKSPAKGVAPWWIKNWQHVMHVAGDTWGYCDNSGRGILLVEMRPATYRTSNVWNWPFAESEPMDGSYYCLDFTNVERHSVTKQVDACGGQNRGYLWLPTGVSVSIVCIISPSMKVIAAKYYDPVKQQKELIFSHLYHTGNNMNDIHTTLTSTTSLAVENLATKTGLSSSEIGVSNIEVSYGMKSLREWFTA